MSKFKIGDRVEVRFNDNWYPGLIVEQKDKLFIVLVLNETYAFGNPEFIDGADACIRAPHAQDRRRGNAWFIENLQYITAVTRMLNETDLPVPPDGMYIHVELRQDNAETVLGQWSDEIAGDAWYFEEA